jgi:hypothetical protein
MPLIIDEVVISIEVNGTKDQSPNNTNKDMRQDIIEECVEQVLDILKQREER